MSSASDIVNDLSELFSSIRGLLGTQTAQAAADLAAELGAEKVLNKAIDFLNDVLEEIKHFLTQMLDPLTHLMALKGVLNLLEPFVNSLQQLIGVVGRQAEESLLKEMVPVTDAVSNAVGVGSDILQGGKEVLSVAPTTQDLSDLISEVTNLGEQLVELKVNGS